MNASSPHLSIGPFVRDAALYSLIPILQRVIGILTVPILTRILFPEEYGITLLITSSLVLITFALSLGLDSAFNVYFCQAEERKDRRDIASTILVVRVMTFGLVTAVVVMKAGQINRLLFPKYDAALVIALAILGYFVTRLVAHFSLVLRFQERHRLRFSLELGMVLAQTAVSLMLIVAFGWRIDGIYMGILSIGLLILPVFVFFSREYVGFYVSLDTLRKLLRFGVPLVPAGLAVFTVQHTASYLINFYSSLDEVGLYSIAYSLAAVLVVGTSGFSQVWAPYVHNHFRKAGAVESFVRIFNLYSVVLLTLGAMISLFAREILSIVTGPDFHAAYEYVPPIILGLAVYAVADYFELGITIRRKTYHRTWIGLVVASFFLITVFPLARWFAVWGVLAAQILSWCLLGLLLQLVSQHLFAVPFPWSRHILMWIVGSFLVGATYRLEASVISTTGKIIVFAVCLALPILFGIMKGDEISTGVRWLGLARSRR